jgi:acyl transferase domain-containing protein
MQVNPLVAASLDTAPAWLPRQKSRGGRQGDGADAGISAFAFQGTNAHAVIGEHHGLSQDAVLQVIVEYELTAYCA